MNPAWLSIGGNLIGGLMGSRAARGAAEAQRRAAERGIGELSAARGYWQPYSDLGATGAGQLQSRIGDLTRRFTADDFEKDPGYDFRMREGQNMVEGSASARGRLFSGAAGKALTQYGQNFASNEFDRAYGRFTNDQNSAYAKLMGLVGVGQNAAQANTGISQGIAGLMAGQGNAQAAGIVGANNAWANALSGAGNAWQEGRMIDAMEEENQLRRRLFQTPPYFAGGNLSRAPSSWGMNSDPYAGP